MKLAVTTLAGLVAAVAAGFYEGTPVIELNRATFDKKVVKSDTVSIVEFYAPWCGHCKNLQPEYVKAAKSLNGLATVAAINCDEPQNKGICTEQQIQGFPTIKVFRPPKVNPKAKKDLDNAHVDQAIPEEYRGARDANAISNFVLSRLRNYVTSVRQNTVDRFLAESETPKFVVLMPNRGKVSGVPPVLKALSSQFIHRVSFGFVDHNQSPELWDKIGVENDNTNKAVLIPVNPDEEPIVFDGELKTKPMAEFLRSYLKEQKKLQKRQGAKAKADL